MEGKTQDYEGVFVYEQDSKRFHRFRIEAGSIVGSLYIPKQLGGVPKKITLTYQGVKQTIEDLEFDLKFDSEEIKQKPKIIRPNN